MPPVPGCSRLFANRSRTGAFGPLGKYLGSESSPADVDFGDEPTESVIVEANPTDSAMTGSDAPATISTDAAAADSPDGNPQT